MEVYTIGRLLKAVRKEKRISQLDMCRGLCTKAMVSYIENELRVPHRKLIEALFSRLGESVDLTKVPMTKADFRRANLEHKLDDCVAIEKNDTKEFLDEYLSCKNSMTHLERQFFDLHESFYMNRNYDKYDSMLPKLVDTLRITIPDHKLHEFPKQKLLSKTECVILNNIAICHFNLGDEDEALSIEYKLKDYFESGIVCDSEKAVNYPVFLFNIVNWERMRGITEHMKQYSELGFEWCRRFWKLTLLPFHLFYIGVSEINSGSVEVGKSHVLLSKNILETCSKLDEIPVMRQLLKDLCDMEFF